jgi:hypothetical protein
MGYTYERGSQAHFSGINRRMLADQGDALRDRRREMGEGVRYDTETPGICGDVQHFSAAYMAANEEDRPSHVVINRTVTYKIVAVGDGWIETD